MSNKAREFDEIAREVFAPVYPAIVQQILKNIPFDKGACLDVGCGSGYLGLNIAKMSNFHVYSLDNNPDAIEILKENIIEMNVDEKVSPLIGDVHNIPLETNSVQLVISRGSMFFWEEPIDAFNEIYRIMAPGGIAYIGGGFGTPEIKKEIDEKMLKRNPKWLEHIKNNIGSEQHLKWRDIMSKTSVLDFDIIHNSIEMWIVFRKQEDL